MFRLAVIELDGASRAVIEQDGSFFAMSAELAGLSEAPKDILPLLANWPQSEQRIAAWLEAGSDRAACAIAAPAAFLPPIARPGKVVCIGSNYHDHIAEMRVPMTPEYPYSFLKPPATTLRGSGQSVAVPKIAHMIDFEAELAVVVGKTARNVALADALSIVAGYANFNDLSARDWIENRPGVGIDWVRHKAFDGFAPMGPFVVPASFVPDPQDLAIELKVNGAVKQASNTAQMVFGVAQIIVHLSQIMTLEPGDVIATGTPAGTGFGRVPPEFLVAGDVVTMAIGPLGELITPMVA